MSRPEDVDRAVMRVRAASGGPGAEPLHPPLLAALGNFKRACVPAGPPLFHGGRTKSPHADPQARRLTGTRKWFSEDAAYAVSYAFVDDDKYGSPLLWVCRARRDMAALEGSQHGLIPSTPWGPDFPDRFPSRFVDYARAVLDCAGPFALLDHYDGQRYREVLVTSPEDAMDVVDVIALPRSKAAAELLARERLGLR